MRFGIFVKHPEKKDIRVVLGESMEGTNYPELSPHEMPEDPLEFIRTHFPGYVDLTEIVGTRAYLPGHAPGDTPQPPETPDEDDEEGEGEGDEPS